MTEVLIVSLLNGVLYGMLLFMLASGLTLIFSMMGVLNFAHASLYMLGAYFAYEISTRMNFWTGLVVAPLLVGAFGAAIERWGLRTVHRNGHLAELLFTFGLVFVIEEAVQLVWGRLPRDYVVPAELDFTLFRIHSTGYPAYRIFTMLLSTTIFLGLLVSLTRTRIGLVIQAALTHPRMVQMLGHDVDRIATLVFGVGCALAGLAGVIGGNVLVTDPNMGHTIGTIVFVVIVVGGLGSLAGALIASLCIGILQTMAVPFDVPIQSMLPALGASTGGQDGLLSRVTISRLGPLVPYLMLVLVLVLRPRGLLGKRDT